MLNKIILIGRLTRDPELRHIPNGTATCKFSIAVDRPVKKDKDKETDFIDIVAWGKLAEVVANYLTKGRLVAVDGRLQIRAYDDNQGAHRKATEVVANDVRFLDQGRKAGSGAAEAGTGINFDEDDIPF